MEELLKSCQREEWSKAIRSIQGIMREQGESPSLLCNRSFCYGHLELHKHALKDAEKALSLDPSYALAYLRKGNALNKLEKRKEAVTAWKAGRQTCIEKQLDLELCLTFSKLLNEIQKTLDFRNLRADVAETQSTSKAQHNESGPLGQPLQSKSLPVLENSQSQSQPAGIPVLSTSQNPAVSDSVSPRKLNKCSDVNNDEKVVDKGQGTESSSANQVANGRKEINGELAKSIKGGPPQSLQSLMHDIKLRKTGAGQFVNIDLRLSLGIQKVNSGQFDEAIDLFTKVIVEDEKAVGAYVGRGTAYAFQRKLEKAIGDFTKAIDLEPRVAEAWKRRAQARSALGFSKDVVNDFTQL